MMENVDAEKAFGELIEKVKFLEQGNKKLQVEFDYQRARFKELFIQKENELENVRKELDGVKDVKQVLILDKQNQQKINILRELIQDTFNEFSILKFEIERVQDENRRTFKREQELISLVQTKLFAEKDDDNEPMKKENISALKSIVGPLDEEINTLKLRSNDNEFQSSSHSSKSLQKKESLEELSDQVASKTSTQKHECDTCKSSENQFSEKKLLDFQTKVKNLTKSLECSKEELKKEASLRTDLENQWQQNRELHKLEVQALNKKMNKIDKEVNSLRSNFVLVKDEILQQLEAIATNRIEVDRHLNELQNHNEFLSGRYLASANELDNQKINLPNNVEELHELFLKQKQDLIQARICYEFEKKKHEDKCNEVLIYRNQFISVEAEKKSILEQHHLQTKFWKEKMENEVALQQNFERLQSNFERNEKEMKKVIFDLETQVKELQDANEKHLKTKNDLTSKIKNLQEDLATSEHVQKDFVQLSQSLQVALETFRQTDKQVRWQDDEDIDKCAQCNVYFTVTCRKQHCRHCGTIYCEKCLNKTVPSGPRNKLVRVCNMCHTLLTPNTAPYFSDQS